MLVGWLDWFGSGLLGLVWLASGLDLLGWVV